jgi:hypothetical protein
MTDNRIGSWSDDEFEDVADDVIYVADADEDVRSDPSIWASVVAGAHFALRWGLGRRGGVDGTGAG